MAPSALYAAKPLDVDAQRQIRLLHFADDPGDGSISCKMEVYDLNAEHECLSYEWGSPDDPKAIDINGHEVYVSRNLYSFLQVYIKRDMKSAIWIDQLCIDQKKPEERNAQVEIMSAIYSLGTRTLVWLGPDPDDGLVTSAIQKRVLPEHDPEYDGTGGAIDRLDAKWRSSLTDLEAKAVERLCTLSYWSRQWILQEIALSSSLLLLYGHAEFEFADINWLPETGLSTSASKSVMKALLPILRGVSEAEGHIKVWYFAMEYTAKSFCKDPRDKVFGIQYLLPTELWIDIDYEQSVEEVFLEAAETYFYQSEICLPSERKGLDPGIGGYGILQGLAELAVGMGIAKEKQCIDIHFRLHSRQYIEERHYRQGQRTERRSIPYFDSPRELKDTPRSAMPPQQGLDPRISWREMEWLIHGLLLESGHSPTASECGPEPTPLAARVTVTIVVPHEFPGSSSPTITIHNTDAKDGDCTKQVA